MLSSMLNRCGFRETIEVTLDPNKYLNPRVQADFRRPLQKFHELHRDIVKAQLDDTHWRTGNPKEGSNDFRGITKVTLLGHLGGRYLTIVDHSNDWDDEMESVANVKALQDYLQEFLKPSYDDLKSGYSKLLLAYLDLSMRHTQAPLEPLAPDNASPEPLSPASEPWASDIDSEIRIVEVDGLHDSNGDACEQPGASELVLYESTKIAKLAKLSRRLAQAHSRTQASMTVKGLITDGKTSPTITGFIFDCASPLIVPPPSTTCLPISGDEVLCTDAGQVRAAFECDLLAPESEFKPVEQICGLLKDTKADNNSLVPFKTHVVRPAIRHRALGRLSGMITYAVYFCNPAHEQTRDAASVEQTCSRAQPQVKSQEVDVCQSKAPLNAPPESPENDVKKPESHKVEANTPQADEELDPRLSQVISEDDGNEQDTASGFKDDDHPWLTYSILGVEGLPDDADIEGVPLVEYECTVEEPLDSLEDNEIFVAQP